MDAGFQSSVSPYCDVDETGNEDVDGLIWALIKPRQKRRYGFNVALSVELEKRVKRLGGKVRREKVGAGHGSLRYVGWTIQVVPSSKWTSPTENSKHRFSSLASKP